MIEVALVCPFCGKSYTVLVPYIGYLDWQLEDVPIQEAMPEVSAEIRECLISGICEDCQTAIFE